MLFTPSFQLNLCIFYLLWTILCSFYYFSILIPSVRNDYWWSSFNTSGTQTFLGDVFNCKLLIDDKFGIFQLNDFYMEKDYNSYSTYIEMRYIVARRLILEPISIEIAIHVLRNNTFDENLRTLTPHCWVDFNKEWELGHTAKRQKRCYLNDRMNAAVYLESMIRNTPPISFLSSQYYPAIKETIFQAIEIKKNGIEWVQKYFNFTMISHEEEIKTWKKYNIIQWINQLQNLNQEGIEETIAIRNALGVEQWIKITSIPSSSRGRGGWTSGWGNAGIFNDVLLCVAYKCSLVRGDLKHVDHLGLDWDSIYDGTYNTNGSFLLRNELGPYMSIDFRYHSIPSSLLNYTLNYLFSIYPSVRSISSYFNFKPNFYYIVPIAWQEKELNYMGGNPLCPFGTPLPYLQHSFGYYDDCSTQDIHLIEFDRRNLLFAIAATNITNDMIPLLCTTAVSATISCIAMLTEALLLASKLELPSPTNQVIDHINDINITFMQVAMNTTNGDTFLLSQSLLDGMWSFHGWTMLWDWVDGRREVYTFEGDESSMTLMSRAHGYVLHESNPLELPQIACNYIRFIALYMSIVLLGVGLIIILLLGLNRLHIKGRNLLFFNRVVGSVWIGRPLLFLRGMTAIVMLCTAPLELIYDNGLSSIITTPRTIIQTIVIVGEASWIVYFLNDILLPLTHPYSSLYSPISSVLSMLILFAVDRLSPLVASAIIERKCSIISFNLGLVCQSGTIEIGSLSRVLYFLLIQLGCILVAYLGCRILDISTQRVDLIPQHHLIIPAAATTFFHQLSDDSYDHVARMMCGILPLFHFDFDMKLWTVVSTTSDGHIPNQSKIYPGMNSRVLTTSYIAFLSPRRIRVRSLVGLAYIILSVSGSYTFLSLSESTMDNDFWWITFKDNYTQAYLCNWFNRQLLVTSNALAMSISNPSHASVATKKNTNDPYIHTAASYPNKIQDEINSLSNVISAMRTMDGCELPWIFTAYCYVDFNRTWTMATTSRRQIRCEKTIDNGAMYLEGLLRNGDITRLHACFHTGLEYGVYSALRTSNRGKDWLQRTLAGSGLSVDDEVGYWKQAGVVTYTTQWQNFKLLGVIESFTIENSFGVSYPLTLTKSNLTWQLSKQTSYKMYWGLANDLTAIASNVSSMSRLSLIQGANAYAYANRSFESFLVEAAYLKFPLNVGHVAFQSTVGAFGSIDMKRVTVPVQLIEHYKKLSQDTISFLASSLKAQQDFWPVHNTALFAPKPTTWDGHLLWGGNFLCPEGQEPLARAQMYFSVQGSCGVNLRELIWMPTKSMIQLLLITGLGFNFSQSNITSTCNRDSSSMNACIAMLKPVQKLLLDSFSPEVALSWYTTTRHLRSVLQMSLNLQLVQYMSVNWTSPIILSQVEIFQDVNFEFFAWSILHDWVEGNREVVSFEGDVSTLTTISSYYSPISTSADPMEIPLNVALYLLRVVQYFTFVLICVATTSGLYILTSRGYIEGMNMLCFNRVCGLVWLGRPFMLVRSLTAICLLSTATLKLTAPQAGLVMYLASQAPNGITIFFSAGEVAWLVYILNDLFSIATRQYTSLYAVKSSHLLWLIAGIWSMMSPIEHTVDVVRTCSLDSVDGQAVCHGGNFSIGSDERFLSLIILSGGCCLVCFAFDRLSYPNLKPTSHGSSLLLYSAANHQFHKDQWIYQSVYYLDTASGALNGVLSIPYQSNFYVFDVKTWRVYILPANQMENRPLHLDYALPLPENTI